MGGCWSDKKVQCDPNRSLSNATDDEDAVDACMYVESFQVTATPTVCQARQGTKPINRKNQEQEIIEWSNATQRRIGPRVCKRTIIQWLPRNHRYKYKWMNRKIKQGVGVRWEGGGVSHGYHCQNKHLRMGASAEKGGLGYVTQASLHQRIFIWGLRKESFVELFRLVLVKVGGIFHCQHFRIAMMGSFHFQHVFPR